MDKNIVIVDSGMCNASSVANAVRYVGGNPIISGQEDDINNAHSIILPWVGAF